MREIGINISSHKTKSVRDLIRQGKVYDYVITVCDNAKELCPVFPGGTKVVHWPFSDPPQGQVESKAILDEFRKVRDLIHQKFRDFVLEITKS